MLSMANWLLSLTAVPPLLLDGLSIHPLVSDDLDDPALDGLGRPDARALTVVRITELGSGRFRAAVANHGALPVLLLQGEELPHAGDDLEAATPALLPSHAVATLEVRRRRPGGATPHKVEARLRRLDDFAPPPGTVGYLAMLGRDLARLELFPGPSTCRRRWWWALGSVVALADGGDPSGQAEAAARGLILRLAAACRSGAWRDEAWAVRRLQAPTWPSLIGRAVVSGASPIYLDLAQLPGRQRVIAAEPVPRPSLTAAASLSPAEAEGDDAQRSGSRMLT